MAVRGGSTVSKYKFEYKSKCLNKKNAKEFEKKT